MSDELPSPESDKPNQAALAASVLRFRSTCEHALDELITHMIANEQSCQWVQFDIGTSPNTRPARILLALGEDECYMLDEIMKVRDAAIQQARKDLK